MAFSDLVLDWFDQHGRHDLPWQRDITPYRVWVSEIMLQQTQVSTVIGYYERFTATFPDVNALADANEDAVLHLWTGLGYYARARNLHRTARIVARELGGEFPDSVEALTQLPGIGRSTAGAIVAIACGGRGVILDANVKRVLARHFAIGGWPGSAEVSRALWAKAEATTPSIRTRDYTQAIMDLGATVCSRKPKCIECPIRDGCVAHRENSTAMYPGKRPRPERPVRHTFMLIIENEHGEVLLGQRPPTGLWGGLWSFPEADDPDTGIAGLHLNVTTREPLLPFRHSFTHFHLDIEPLRLHVSNDSHVNESGMLWIDPRDPPEIGLTRPVTRILGSLYQDRLI